MGPKISCAHDRQLGSGIDDEGRQHLARAARADIGGSEFARRIQGDDASTLGASIRYQVGEALIVPAVDDGGVVGVVDDARVEFGDGIAALANEVLEPSALDHHIVGGDAGLPRVQQLAPDDALRCRGVVEVGVHDGGRLAAQLQRHRRQVLRRRPHHELADGGRAGEENVVEGKGA